LVSPEGVLLIRGFFFFFFFLSMISRVQATCFKFNLKSIVKVNGTATNKAGYK